MTTFANKGIVPARRRGPVEPGPTAGAQLHHLLPLHAHSGAIALTAQRHRLVIAVGAPTMPSAPKEHLRAPTVGAAMGAGTGFRMNAKPLQRRLLTATSGRIVRRVLQEDRTVGGVLQTNRVHQVLLLDRMSGYAPANGSSIPLTALMKPQRPLRNSLEAQNPLPISIKHSNVKKKGLECL